MTTQLQRPTAKIFAFPSGGRAPPSRYRDVPKTSGRTASARTADDEQPAKVEFGDCWYHEAAVDTEVDEACER
jgi:hypothetical protein